MEFFTGFESFVGVNFWTCIFTLCNFLILYKIMKKLLFKPVMNMIDSRQKEIDGMYDDANKSKEDAAELKVQYEQRLANARDESEEILREASRKAQQNEERIIQEARVQAEDIIRRADAEIAQQRKKVVNELKNEISSISIGIAEKMLDREIKEEDHEALINRFIEEMGEDDE